MMTYLSGFAVGCLGMSIVFAVMRRFSTSMVLFSLSVMLGAVVLASKAD